jgi:hypothetical protein
MHRIEECCDALYPLMPSCRFGVRKMHVDAPIYCTSMPKENLKGDLLGIC